MASQNTLPQAQPPWYVGTGQGATLFTRNEAQRFARNILQSDDYRNSVTSRAKTGTLPPAIEALLWHYAYGKPVEQVSLTVTPGTEDLSQLPLDELQRRADAVTDALREANALASAIGLDPQGNVIQGNFGQKP